MYRNKSNKRLYLLTCIFCFSVGIFCSDSILPSLPAITHALHSSEATIKLTISLYFVSIGVSTLAYGPLIEQFGARRCFFMGVPIFLAGSVVCLLSQNAGALIVGRVVQGIGAGAYTTVARGAIPTLYKGTQLTKVASMWAVISAMIPAVAPMAGGYVQHYFGWHANFAMIIFVVIVSGMVALFYLPDVKPTQQRFSWRFLFSSYQSAVADRTFILCPIISGLGYFSVICYVIFSPFLLQVTFGFSALQYSYLTLMTSLSLVLSALLSRFLANHLSSVQALLFASRMMVVGSLGLLGIQLFHPVSVFSVLVPCFLVLMGVFVMTANTFSLSMRLAKNLGIASALIGFVQLAGSGLLATVLSAIPSHSAITLGCCLSVVSVANLFCIYQLRKGAARYAFSTQERIH